MEGHDVDKQLKTNYPLDLIDLKDASAEEETFSEFLVHSCVCNENVSLKDDLLRAGNDGIRKERKEA